MGHPKGKSVSVASNLNMLLRSRASRDITMRKIRNLDMLAWEAQTEVDKQRSFMARSKSLY